MSPLKKKLIVVGDRLLVRPENGEEKTNAGLYLPATALSARTAQGGWVVTVGPGIPLPDLTEDLEEPWQTRGATPRYLPLQAQEGDYVLFVRKAAVEITFEGKRYLIVPNSAVLVLVRDDWEDAPELAGGIDGE